MSEKPPTEFLRYFVPNELVLQVSVPPGGIDDESLQSLKNTLLDNIQAGFEGIGTFSFNREQSIIRFDSDSYTYTESETPQFFVLIPTRLNLAAGSEIQQQQNLGRLLVWIDENRVNLLEGFPETALEYVGPNWLFGGQGHMPGGGPTGRPTPEPKPSATAQSPTPSVLPKPFIKERLDCVMPKMIELLRCYEVGTQPEQPVNVVILDTAPPEPMLTSTANSTRDNELLAWLRGNLNIVYAHDPRLNITFPAADLPPDPALAAADSQVADYYRRYGGYEMPDHGLFIAGIVHELAPNANIYLIEVLDKWGRGTIASIASGLAAIHSIVPNPTAPMIINMSLCIDFGLADEILEALPMFSLPFIQRSLAPLLFPIQTVQGQKRDLEDSVDSTVRTLNAIIVAAAGNEASENNAGQLQAPQARYPAAYNAVIGVGALNKDGTRAWYSNQADAPPLIGVVTLGGAAEGQPDKISPSRLKSVCAPGTSILGAYSNPKFPDPHGQMTIDNESGMAWWSGTSFATAVMSGIFADMALQGVPVGNPNGPDVLDVIQFITNLHGSTQIGEPILLVEQL